MFTIEESIEVNAPLPAVVHGDLERFKELVEAGGANGGWGGEVKRRDGA